MANPEYLSIFKPTSRLWYDCLLKSYFEFQIFFLNFVYYKIIVHVISINSSDSRFYSFRVAFTPLPLAFRKVNCESSVQNNVAGYSSEAAAGSSVRMAESYCDCDASDALPTLFLRF